MNRLATLSTALMLTLLLGTSDSLAGALGTLLMFATVVGLYGLCMPALRSRLSGTNALLASLLLAATFTSCADLLAQRWFLPWQQAFGLYTSLIALQCVVLEHHGFWHQSLAERFKLCATFGGLMLVLAGLRELIGHGSLGRGLSESWPGLVLFNEGLHLITLIPGAFILLALLLAARQAVIRPNSISKETHRP
ncbi:Rnf-Nqr domain containing protein [Pseudomonas fluorescens]|uniref:Rnf-Nqr domain containing protein n=1 Tax=Pseudomonas fluorescens TaxID=294 RepID=UPI00124018AE|nr:Rnf-Nqr domain containing protein [Pseudomonas fluorescens]VVQ31559.1 Electron transport complex subunit RsxE [Pseudomonas fluorescens]